MSFDLTNFQVGDEFETSPHELGIVISAILAEGGSFSYEGNSVIIKSLPNRQVVEVPEYNFSIPEVEPEPVVEVSLEPVVEEVDPEPVVEVSIETAVEEAVAEEAKPKVTGRPRKKVETVENEIE